MTIQLFSSGSAGNCCLIKTKNNNILLDVGISKKSLLSGLETNNLALNDINAILITHAHDDHIRALASILRTYNIKTYMTNGTLGDILRSKDQKIIDLYKSKLENKVIEILTRQNNDLLYNTLMLDSDIVTALPTFHDATESIGYIIKSDDKKLVYITDTGYVHSSLFSDIANANAYVLESNYDPYTLMHSSRPENNKLRILSDHGHMSNEDSAIVLASVMGEKTKLVMHAHISQECNLAQILIDTRNKVFNDYGLDTSEIEFVITSPRPTKEYEI